MGHTLSKEEEAVVKLLQHILSKRGIKYDEACLKQLLQWSKDRNLLISVGTAFELSTWEAIGASLWDEISDESKEV